MPKGAVANAPASTTRRAPVRTDILITLACLCLCFLRPRGDPIGKSPGACIPHACAGIAAGASALSRAQQVALARRLGGNELPIRIGASLGCRDVAPERPDVGHLLDSLWVARQDGASAVAGRRDQ